MTKSKGRIIQWDGEQPLPTVPNVNYASHILSAFADHKENVALVDGSTDTSYTYGDLLRIIPRMRNGLAAAGVSPGDRVLLITPNHVDMPPCVLAIILSGATCVPVNPGSTKEELKHVIGLSKAKWAIVYQRIADKVHSAFREMAPNPLRKMWMIGGATSASPSIIELYNSTSPDPPKQKNFDASTTVALMPLSSGTTGLPKGVMLSHKNMVALRVQSEFMAALSSFGDINMLSSVVIVIPMYHMMGFNLMMSTLSSGGKGIILPRFSPKLYLQATEKYKATSAIVVPYIMRALENSPLLKNFDLSSLLMFGTGSEPIPSSTLKNLIEKTGKFAAQGYGMSESSGVGSFCTPDTALREHCIGKFQAFFQAKVIDVETGEILGEGEDGELCLRGPLIMLGYADNPKDTADTIDSEGWLHTGDITHFDEDNNFYITGRLKDLIKVKGYQVAPLELEKIINEIEGVGEVAVAGVPHQRLGEAPRAWVVPNKGATLDPQEIMKFVAGKVMPYKQLAGGVELVRTIPKNHIGKVMRRQLRKSYESKHSKL